jgi:hypothetical protein
VNNHVKPEGYCTVWWILASKIIEKMPFIKAVILLLLFKKSEGFGRFSI